MPETMSNFFEVGRKPVRVPEKSNFSQTCSMLSQYLKERGSFGDLSLGMTCNLEDNNKDKSETLCQTEKNMMNNLKSNNKISGDFSMGSSAATSSSCKVKSMDLFPQDAGFGSTAEDVPKKAAEFSEIMPAKEPETTPQMTIFYAGKVLVFDNFLPNKVKEVMQMASSLTTSPVSQNNGSSAPTTGNGAGTDQINSAGLNASASNFPSVSGINNSTQESSFQAKLSDLPIARKASLHRFLEKRKDRIGARAPYQVNSLSKAPLPAKPEENKMWLGLASESSKLF